MKSTQRFVALWLLAASAGAVAWADDVPLFKRSDSTPAEAAYTSGVKHLERGDLKEAQAAFQKSLNLDSTQVAALVGLAEVAQLGKEFKKAEPLFLQALAREPRNAGVQASWGHFLESQKRFDEAEAAYRKSIEIQPSSAAIQISLGDILLRVRNKPQEAVQWYRSALKINSKHGGGYYALGVALARLGQTDEALRSLETAGRLAPNNPLPQQALGELLLAKKDTAGALKAFEAAAQAQPGFIFAYLARGDIFLQAGDLTKALAQFRRAHANSPQSAIPLVRAGMAYQAHGRYADAKREYLEALRKDKTAALAYNNLAWIATQEKRDLDNALSWANQAVALLPADAGMHDTLGWVHYVRAEYTKARERLRNAVKINGAGAEVFYHLGVVCEKLGDKQEAERAFRRALSLGKGFDGAADAEKRLAEYSRR